MAYRIGGHGDRGTLVPDTGDFVIVSREGHYHIGKVVDGPDWAAGVSISDSLELIVTFDGASVTVRLREIVGVLNVETP